MKPFLGAVVVALLMAVGAAFVLERQYLTPSYEAFATGGARIESQQNARGWF
jgi:hypothetical protein